MSGLDDNVGSGGSGSGGNVDSRNENLRLQPNTETNNGQSKKGLSASADFLREYNGVIALLYMIPEFRQVLYRMDARDGTVTRALQTIFMRLQFGDDLVETQLLYAAYENKYGEPVTDVDNRQFLNKVLRAVKDDAVDKDSITELFRGKMTVYLRSLQCDHRTSTDVIISDLLLHPRSADGKTMDMLNEYFATTIYITTPCSRCDGIEVLAVEGRENPKWPYILVLHALTTRFRPTDLSLDCGEYELFGMLLVDDHEVRTYVKNLDSGLWFAFGRTVTQINFERVESTCGGIFSNITMMYRQVDQARNIRLPTKQDLSRQTLKTLEEGVIDGAKASNARQDSIQTQSMLQSKIEHEDKVVENRTDEILNEWEKDKPVEGSQHPEVALQALAVFETKLNHLQQDRDNVLKAKEALELSNPSQPSPFSEKLRVSIEELQDLKNIWRILRPVYQEIDEVKEKPWLSVQPRKLRQQIDGLLAQLKDLPAQYRNYGAYDHVERMLQGYAKANMLVVGLKSEALKERHWKQLMKQLRVNWVLSDLTLGQVLDADLHRHEAAIKDMLLVAQGELALEEFLKQVREVWQSYELELVSYQNKRKLIRGWDDLFNTLKDHINSINAMKLSPLYKEFEEESLAWEEKLNRINAMFDVWVDVQRRWIYLDGIFNGSADIKALLPVETSRFHNVSCEFLGLMTKVALGPQVVNAMNIQGVQQLLERLSNLLAECQKALGEYLERERSSFPRFYFVDDEDLLEIIGSSENIHRLQKHFKKMFAGVSSILLSEDSTICSGVASREGEEVKFVNEVSIKDNPRVSVWLSLIDKEIRNSLALMLAQSVEEVRKFKGGKIDPTAYMQWMDSYPAQIIVLSAQISWSEEVEAALARNTKLENTLKTVEATLNLLGDSVMKEQPPLRRKKLEHLISEFENNRDVTRQLINDKVNSNKSIDWLRQMRFYLDPDQADVLRKLSIHLGDSKFSYGFEYLAVQDKLVQAPLTDRCYSTMIQALDGQMGDSRFEPAGIEKTESVKALGNQLGRFVLVFKCDETFDFQAMERILLGLCQMGAWGCFDGLNRLEERMLSAVSQQVQAIQETLRSVAGKGDESLTVELFGKQVPLHPDMAIFITMNPGYAGRSNLPEI